MVKSLLALAAAAAVCAAPFAYAQSDVPGEGRAAPSKPATKSEKESAKQTRKASGKEVVKKDEGRIDDTGSSGKAKSASADEKAAAKAKRSAEGKAAAKADQGRAEEEGKK